MATFEGYLFNSEHARISPPSGNTKIDNFFLIFDVFKEFGLLTELENFYITGFSRSIFRWLFERHEGRIEYNDGFIGDSLRQLVISSTYAHRCHINFRISMGAPATR